jgi:proliferating cell nuclear antigen PCNA
MSFNLAVSEPSKARAFSAIFQNMKHFCDHVNIVFEKERAYAQGMDNSHISIFELFIPASWFDSYNHPSEENIVVGINVGLFYKIMNTRDEGQEIFIKYDPEKQDKLYLHFITSTPSTKPLFDKHFELPLIEIETEMMSIPDVEYAAEFSLLSANFAGIVGQLKQFGADMLIKCNEQEIRLTAKSTDTGNMSVVVPIDDLSLFAINEGETLNLSFSLSHLHNICSFYKVSDSVNLKISDNYPLKATYLLEKVSDEEDDVSGKARIVVFLAPRISDEDANDM